MIISIGQLLENAEFRDNVLLLISLQRQVLDVKLKLHELEMTELKTLGKIIDSTKITNTKSQTPLERYLALN